MPRASNRSIAERYRLEATCKPTSPDQSSMNAHVANDIWNKICFSRWQVCKSFKVIEIKIETELVTKIASDIVETVFGQVGPDS